MESWSHPKTTSRTDYYHGSGWLLGMMVLFEWDALRPNASIDLDVWLV